MDVAFIVAMQSCGAQAIKDVYNLTTASAISLLHKACNMISAY
jgi:hypothetical protein